MDPVSPSIWFSHCPHLCDVAVAWFSSQDFLCVSVHCLFVLPSRTFIVLIGWSCLFLSVASRSCSVLPFPWRVSFSYSSFLPFLPSPPLQHWHMVGCHSADHCSYSHKQSGHSASYWWLADPNWFVKSSDPFSLLDAWLFLLSPTPCFLPFPFSRDRSTYCIFLCACAGFFLLLSACMCLLLFGPRCCPCRRCTHEGTRTPSGGNSHTEEPTGVSCVLLRCLIICSFLNPSFIHSLPSAFSWSCLSDHVCLIMSVWSCLSGRFLFSLLLQESFSPVTARLFLPVQFFSSMTLTLVKQWIDQRVAPAVNTLTGSTPSVCSQSIFRCPSLPKENVSESAFACLFIPSSAFFDVLLCGNACQRERVRKCIQHLSIVWISYLLVPGNSLTMWCLFGLLFYYCLLFRRLFLPLRFSCPWSFPSLSPGRTHPQALIYPLTVAAKSQSSARQQAATAILDKMRQHSPVLVDQALLVKQRTHSCRHLVAWSLAWSTGRSLAVRLAFWFLISPSSRSSSLSSCFLLSFFLAAVLWHEAWWKKHRGSFGFWISCSSLSRFLSVSSSLSTSFSFHCHLLTLSVSFSRDSPFSLLSSLPRSPFVLLLFSCRFHFPPHSSSSVFRTFRWFLPSLICSSLCLSLPGYILVLGTSKGCLWRLLLFMNWWRKDLKLFVRFRSSKPMVVICKRRMNGVKSICDRVKKQTWIKHGNYIIMSFEELINSCQHWPNWVWIGGKKEKAEGEMVRAARRDEWWPPLWQVDLGNNFAPFQWPGGREMTGDPLSSEMHAFVPTVRFLHVITQCKMSSRPINCNHLSRRWIMHFGAPIELGWSSFALALVHPPIVIFGYAEAFVSKLCSVYYSWGRKFPFLFFAMPLFSSLVPSLPFFLIFLLLRTSVCIFSIARCARFGAGCSRNLSSEDRFVHCGAIFSFLSSLFSLFLSSPLRASVCISSIVGRSQFGAGCSRNLSGGGACRAHCCIQSVLARHRVQTETKKTHPQGIRWSVWVCNVHFSLSLWLNACVSLILHPLLSLFSFLHHLIEDELSWVSCLCVLCFFSFCLFRYWLFLSAERPRRFTARWASHAALLSGQYALSQWPWNIQTRWFFHLFLVICRDSAFPTSGLGWMAAQLWHTACSHQRVSRCP